jgi:6-phosphogluconolactonase
VSPAPATRRFIVGSYGPPVGTSPGLHLLTHDRDREEISVVPLARTESPSFVVVADDGTSVYSVEESEEGAVHAWRWTSREGNELEPLGGRPSYGAHPCHLAIHPAGFLITANYTTGTVAVHRLARDGSIGEVTDVHELHGSGPNRSRQDRAHAHMVTIVDGDVAVADLGSDKVWHLTLDDRGRLVLRGALQAPPGSGTRQVLFSSDGSTAYILGELDGSLATAAWPPSGALRTHARVATGELPPDNLSAALVAGDGDALYASHRGADVVTEIDIRSPVPRVVRDIASHGRWPRHIAVLGSHLYCANQYSDAVSCVRLDAPDGQVLRAETPSPSCLAPLR